MVQPMIEQWENECTLLAVLSMARVRLPSVAEYFKGFSKWLIWRTHARAHTHTHTHTLIEEIDIAKSSRTH